MTDTTVDKVEFADFRATILERGRTTEEQLRYITSMQAAQTKDIQDIKLNLKDLVYKNDLKVEIDDLKTKHLENKGRDSVFKTIWGVVWGVAILVLSTILKHFF